MPEMVIKKFEPVPAGTYLVSVKSVELVKQDLSKNIKNDFYSWKLEIIDDEVEQGKIITFGGSVNFSPNTKTFKFLVATGLLDPSFEEGVPNTDDFIGAQLYVTVKVDPNTNGKTGMKNTVTATQSIAEVEALAAKVSQRQPVNRGVTQPTGVRQPQQQQQQRITTPAPRTTGVQPQQRTSSTAPVHRVAPISTQRNVPAQTQEQPAAENTAEEFPE